LAEVRIGARIPTCFAESKAPRSCLSALEAVRYRRARLHWTRAVIALTLLPLSACNAASGWLAGVDPSNYTWEPPIGQAPAAGTMEKDLKACEGGAGTPSAGASKGDLTITRPEDSEAVAGCMAAKGWTKVYGSRRSMF
jgi:hypothetical protein